MNKTRLHRELLKKQLIDLMNKRVAENPDFDLIIVDNAN